MLQITYDGVTTPPAAELTAMHRDFYANHHIMLHQLVEPSFVRQLVDLIDQANFNERLTEGIGCVETLAHPGAERGLNMMLNHPDLLTAISNIVGKSVHLWVGNTVRRVPDHDHFSQWHDDKTPPIDVNGQLFERTVPLSLNLSREPYEGGNLEIRTVPAHETVADIPNKGLGDAILFEISTALQHRVAPVTGSCPRLVHVGWFHSRVQPV